jgi:hypothetical protein
MYIVFTEKEIVMVVKATFYNISVMDCMLLKEVAKPIIYSSVAMNQKSNPYDITHSRWVCLPLHQRGGHVTIYYMSVCRCVMNDSYGG